MGDWIANAPKMAVNVSDKLDRPAEMIKYIIYLPVRFSLQTLHSLMNTQHYLCG